MEQRDQIMAFIGHWQAKTAFPRKQFIHWLGINRSRYYDWGRRQGCANNHNAPIPKSHWILPEEKQAIINYALKGHLQAGYRRMSYLMLDEDIVAVSPSTVYRVLKEAELIQAWSKPSKKGTGFQQPLMPHEHWHIDFTYLKLQGIFYFLATVLDGCSRAILSWHLKPKMTELEAEIVIQKAREAYPNQKPRIISDNGPQFLSQDFKEFINICEMTHVRTAPYYPQSNGKIERYHKSLKQEAIRPKSPIDLEDAERIIGNYIHDYNHVRLHSSIGFVPPILKLEGKDQALIEERKIKLEKASQARQLASNNNRQTKPFSSKEGNDTNLPAA